MSSLYYQDQPKRERGLAVHIPVIMASVAGLLIVAAVVVWLVARHGMRAELDPMAGYISDVTVLEHEYAAANGKLLNGEDVQQLFQRASELAHKGEVIQASELLETAAKAAAVPVVFHDLGVLYAKMGDHAKTVNALREALARDAHYQPVLRNLARERGITESEARPVTREIEPNSSRETANVIAVGSPVKGEIAASGNDLDTFQFPAPPAPRDTVAVDIAGSPSLMLGWNIYDDAVNEVARGIDDPKPGAGVHFTFAPAPNATFYVSVWGLDQTAGPYVLTVRALKAFDAYEPNDDIFHARAIAVAQTIEANIMDGKDQDFYWFVADRSGTAEIALENDTPKFVPGLTLFGPDQRTIGFAPDAKGPGASLHYSAAVEAGLKYYLQVWPVLDRYAGQYKLRVEVK